MTLDNEGCFSYKHHNYASMDMCVTLCAGILKSEYCHWGPSRAVQAEKLVVNCMTFFKNSMLSKMRFFSKVIFKVNLNVLFSWFLCSKCHFFLTAIHILYKNPRRNTNLNFCKVREICAKKWVSKVTPRLAKRKNSMEIGIYMLFDELVHPQKQFEELAGHFVVRSEVIF